MVSIGTYQRVDVTDAAASLVRDLTAQHGPLMFHQSGGCFDGSSPMCYPVGMFLTGPGVTTLPLEIFSYLQFQGDQLVVAAASALQVGVVVLFLLIAQQVLGARNMVRAEQS